MEMYENDQINEFNHIILHLKIEWNEKILEDGMFDDVEEENWKINQENAAELLDALNISEYVKLDEIQKLISNYNNYDENDV